MSSALPGMVGHSQVFREAILSFEVAVGVAGKACKNLALEIALMNGGELIAGIGDIIHATDFGA